MGFPEAVGAPEDDSAENNFDEVNSALAQLESVMEYFPHLNSIGGDSNAVIKSKFAKSPKGKSKERFPQPQNPGKGAQPPPASPGTADGGADAQMKVVKNRNCYECNETDHIARDCPVRRTRVEQGGLERLPKGKCKGKGVLTWKNFEGPLRWLPVAAKPGASALFQQPYQLSPFMAGTGQGQGTSVLQSLFEHCFS